MGGRMSHGREVEDEDAYEEDARRWLRAYPPRWRRAREDEVVGVLLDTRVPDVHRLPWRDRLDLVRGALGYRWRTHPPFVQWLLWRWCDVPPAPAYREWAVDDVAGRLFDARRVWLGWTGPFALAMALSLSDLGREPTTWALTPVVVCLVLGLVPAPWYRRRLLRELNGLAQDDRLARGFDRSVPWTWRHRYAWDARILLPCAGLAAGTVVALAVVAAWWTDPGARATTTRLRVAPLWEADPALVLVPLIPMLPVGGLAVVVLLGVVVLAARRARARPAQPWRAPLTPLPLWLAGPATALAALLPLAVAALPALALALPPGADTSPGSPASDAAATAVGALTGLVPLLVLAYLTAAALVLTWWRVRRAVASAPGPDLALVDVLSLRGGDRVAVDTPVLLRPQTVLEYPPAPAGGTATHPH